MSDILTGFNMQGNDPIDDRIVSKSNLETLEQYLNRVPVQKRYYGLTFFALDKNNELRKYTFQTSLIEPTIDDDEEEIERIDKELQEHVSNKAIHKTSEEIRSEIVDADIPDTIARVQWTLDQINTAVINLIGGASDEYNTLKRIQTKIEELRAEMESQLYGDDGGTVLKTLEQALKFLNQYKDFIVDIPDNFVSKQDIVDNLTTDDPTKVLSAKQGKVLSDTLTNYFESAMQSIRTETDRAINAENRIETKLDKEIERSTNEDIRIDNKLDSEINRSIAEDDRLDKKIDAETTRATTAESNLNTKIETETDRAEGEESRIETKLDNEITRSTNKDTEHDNRLQALEGQTHEQNTDLGTTNSTFQLKYNTGNKIKHESDAISVRNAADTDYVNFIAKNATFKGDLLVEGQSFVTEAETVEIKDNLLLLNKGEVGAGVTKGIAGLEIDRGTEPNYQIIFDESDNRFKAGEIGDIQCLALRDGDDSMTGGMFTSWDSTTKRLKTTNIVPSSSFLYFGDNKTVSLNYSSADDGLLKINTNNQYLAIFTGDNFTNFRSTRNKFQFIGDSYTTGTKYALTFKRNSDNSEVLYHADIVNNLTSGGTNKVLSAEQGKLLQNSITSIQGSYLPLSGGTMTGSITFPNRKGIFGRLTDGTGNIKIAVVNANNNVEIGNSNTPLMLVSNSTDLTHYRDNNTYKIWDAYNLPNPVTYIADENNYATLKNKDGNNFTYIKTGVNGILPSTAVNLTSGGYGGLGSNNWSFDTGYINHLHTNKISFGVNGPYIIGSTSATQFLDANGGVQKVATGGLYVGPSYASDALNLVPANGIYSRGIIYIENGIGFRNSIWTNDLTPNRNYSGYLQVLDAYDAANAGGPTNYGTVLQINSRNSHWANQLWFPGGAEASKNGLYYRHMAYNQTEYGDWIKLATTSDLGNYLPLSGGTISSSKSNPLTINSTHVSQSSIDFSRGGVNKGTVGFYESLGSFLQNVTGETLAVKSDGAYYGASSSTLTKLLTSADLSSYATQSWANSQFAPLKNYFVTSNYASIATTGNEMCIGSLTSGNSIINVNYRNGTGTTSPSTWYWRAGSSTTWANAYWGNLYMNYNLVATQTWSNSQYPLKTGAGASGTWDINISGNASTASAASKLGSTTIGGSAKPIYLSSGTPTACSATVGSATVPVYMNAGTITQCSTTLGVSITGNAATATNASQLGGTAASSYVKANDNISRLTNDSGYTTQEWVNGQGFLTSDSLLDKFVPTTGGYIRNSDQVLLRLQRTGVSTGTNRTIEMYFDDSNTDGTSTTPRGSIGYNSEVGMFLYSAKSKKFLAMEYTGRPFYGTPENRYYLLGSNTEYHNLDGFQRIGDIMIQWGYFTVQGNSTRAVNFPVSFTNTVWSVTGSWDNTTTGSQENWGFTNYTSSGFTIINGDGSSRVFHYIAIGPFTRS